MAKTKPVKKTRGKKKQCKKAPIKKVRRATVMRPVPQPVPSAVAGPGGGGVLAVIMARAGSKGLPGKAMRELLGRPVISYTFAETRGARYVSRIVVSSDDKGVVELARREGLETIPRPAKLATDESRTDDVLRHAIKYLRQKEGTRWVEPEGVVMLYGNVPLRRKRMIDRAIHLWHWQRCDSVQTVAAVGKHHPYWCFKKDNQGRITKFIDNQVYRRQELPEIFEPTGAVYVIKTSVLMATEGSKDPHAFLGGDRRGLAVAPEDSVDIDTLQDLLLAEAMMRAEGV